MNYEFEDRHLMLRQYNQSEYRNIEWKVLDVDFDETLYCSNASLGKRLLISFDLIVKPLLFVTRMVICNQKFVPKN